MTKIFISPNFTHQKLEPPFYKDTVDVFEDRIINWLLLPAKKLIDMPHGAIPAISLLINYIEGIEIYISGLDSKGRSKDFFRRGFKRIFSNQNESEQFLDAVANAIYESLRCGFAHEGMFRSRVYFSNDCKSAFLITWPKKNEVFDLEGHLESAIINPKRFMECIEIHFKDYIRELRSMKESPLQLNFKAIVEKKWQLMADPPLIGVTEKDFYSVNY